MGEVKELTRFYNAIRNDPRISIGHISLYMALFQLYNLNGFRNPINVNRKKLMEIAKISSFATFHKVIYDLNELRYIEYAPSYNPAICSTVNLLEL
jgi:hypothetical protein